MAKLCSKETVSKLPQICLWYFGTVIIYCKSRSIRFLPSLATVQMSIWSVKNQMMPRLFHQTRTPVWETTTNIVFQKEKRVEPFNTRVSWFRGPCTNSAAYKNPKRGLPFTQNLTKITFLSISKCLRFLEMFLQPKEIFLGGGSVWNYHIEEPVCSTLRFRRFLPPKQLCLYRHWDVISR